MSLSFYKTHFNIVLPFAQSKQGTKYNVLITCVILPHTVNMSQQHRQCTYSIPLRRVRATIVAVEK